MTLAMPEESPRMAEAAQCRRRRPRQQPCDGPRSFGLCRDHAALDDAGVPWFGQGDVSTLPGLDIVGLTDIDTNGSQHTDLLTPALLDSLIRPDANAACRGVRPLGSRISSNRPRARTSSPTRCDCARSRRSSAHIRMWRAAASRPSPAVTSPSSIRSETSCSTSRRTRLRDHGGNEDLRAGNGIHAHDPTAELLRHGKRVNARPPIC